MLFYPRGLLESPGEPFLAEDRPDRPRGGAGGHDLPEVALVLLARQEAPWVARGFHERVEVRGAVGGPWAMKDHRARAPAHAWSRDLASALPAAAR